MITPTDLSVETRPCQLCGQPSLKRFVVPNTTTMGYCPDCELYQYGVGVEQPHYEAGYHAGYHRALPRKRRTARLRLNRIAACLMPTEAPVRLLDIGSSIGATLEAAGERGWDATGVDVSVESVERCQKRGLDAVATHGMSLPFADKTFDAVCAWHVIEHVDDVRETVAEWSRVLKPGGILALETPDAACPKIRLLGATYRKFWKDEHTYAYTRANLGRFLTEAGLEIVSPPAIGSLRSLGPGMTAYSLARRVIVGSRQALGVMTAFQIFARRPLVASVPQTRVFSRVAAA